MLKNFLKIGLLIVILLSTCVLLTGCGEDAVNEDPVISTDETEELEETVKSNFVEKDYIELTLTEGWELNETRSSSSQIVLEMLDSEEFFKPEIKIDRSNSVSANDRIELWKTVYADAVAQDNVTINEIEYLVLKRDTATGTYLHLATSFGEKGDISVEISHTEIEDVKPILDTIVIKTP